MCKSDTDPQFLTVSSLIPDNAVMLLPIPGDLPCPWKVLHRGVHDGQVTLLEYQFRTGPDPGSCHDQNAQHHLVVRVTERLIDSVIEVDNVDVNVRCFVALAVRG